MFASAIIAASNKTWENGYVSVQECPSRYFSPATSVKRTGVVVYVRLNMKVVLIIECKVAEDDFEIGGLQLENYMVEAECYNGILMNSNKARKFQYDLRGKYRPFQVEADVDLTTNEGLEGILSFVNSC